MSSGIFYIDKLLKSNGQAALNRMHRRSFLVNILEMNAQELMQAIDVVENSELMAPAFQKKNESEVDQIHSEINRLVHNYLCAISTVTGHSRNFMTAHYAKTTFFSDYKVKVKSCFDESEICRFVKDLRNYITHRDLPDSRISLNMKNNGATTTAVTYGVSRFLEWSNWTPLARNFLKQSPEAISIRTIFKPHVAVMSEFELWFTTRFKMHHKTELEELARLHAEYEQMVRSESSNPKDNEPH